VERLQEGVDRPRLQPIEFVERPPARFSQSDHLATAVGLRLLSGHQPGRGETGQDAAEVARVEVEVAANLGYRNVVAMSQLKEHSGLGETECRSGEVGSQQTQHTRVEPVESADVVDHAEHS